METKFNSQICTSREQSRRLLALGLKPETADMSSDGWNDPVISWGMEWSKEVIESGRLPAWSLHRLIKLAYGNWKEDIIPVYLGNSYDMLIGRIEFQVKQGKFNKEYLNGND